MERINRRRENIRNFEELTNSIDRMNQINEETNEQNDRSSRNSLTTNDLNQFRGLPAAIARAIESADIRAEVDLVTAGTALTPVMGTIMGNMLRRQNV